MISKGEQMSVCLKAVGTSQHPENRVTYICLICTTEQLRVKSLA